MDKKAKKKRNRKNKEEKKQISVEGNWKKLKRLKYLLKVRNLQSNNDENKTSQEKKKRSNLVSFFSKKFFEIEGKKKEKDFFSPRKAW